MSEPLPSGPLLWGQAAEYDAIDDRLVITTLAAGTVGLVRPPTLTPGAGLVVNIGGWHGSADCEDGTLAVIGSRDVQTIEVPAGGATPRTDVLFADIDADAGYWQADLYTEAEAATRAGLRLGTITVPAGANSAAQMDMRPATVALARFRGIWSTANMQAAGFGHTPVTPMNGTLIAQAGRSYWFRGQCRVVANGGTGNNYGVYFVLGGSAIMSVFRGKIHWSGPGQAMSNTQTAFNNNGGMNSNPTMQNTQSYHGEIEGHCTCSQDGTVALYTAATVAGNAGVIQQGATLVLSDITAGPAGVYVAPAEPGEPGRIIRGRA
jgi:hypothetical protein